MTHTADEVKAQIELYVKRVQEANDRYTGLNCFSKVNVSVEYGKKNARVINTDTYGTSRSVHTFVNMETGDILKAASWKAPAPNGLRGNVFNENSDVGVTINHFGAAYLR
jgi:hypothetical protein